MKLNYIKLFLIIFLFKGFALDMKLASASAVSSAESAWNSLVTECLGEGWFSAGAADPWGTEKCKALKTSCQEMEAEITSSREIMQSSFATESNKFMNTETIGTNQAITVTNGFKNTVEAAQELHLKNIVAATNTIQATCDATCSHMPQVCRQLEAAIDKGMKAEEADKAESDSFFKNLFSSPLGSAMTAMQLAQLLCFDVLSGGKSEKGDCKEAQEETRDFFCEEPKGSGEFVQIPLSVAEGASRDCRLDKPEKEEEEESEAPSVAGITSEGGEALEKKEAGEAPAESDKGKGEFAETDQEQDLTKDGRNSNGGSGRDSGIDGGFGRGGFQQGGILGDGGRKGFKGKGRRGFDSGGNVGFGGGGGGRGSHGRSNTSSLSVDAGRIDKHKVVQKKKGDTKKIVPPPPEKTIFELIQGKYTKVSGQYIYR
jgi:uncharacterized membrane protein YgcG